MKKCPLCEGFGKTIFDEKVGGFDNSFLYDQVKIFECNKCGHLYNILTEEDINGIDYYYNNEYSKINEVSINTVGDMPGSNNTYTIERYRRLYDFIKPYFENNSILLDVGCNNGGFLNYVDGKGNYILYGTDITVGYLSKLSPNIISREGRAENLPFEGKQFNMVVMDQVLEHLIEPSKAFQEAKRVLKGGGYLCISVPDAMRYSDHSFFPYYFFLMREHIQHFDLHHLILVAKMNGFSLIKFEQTDSTFMSESTIIPTITCLFEVDEKKSISYEGKDLKILGGKTSKYLSMDNLFPMRDTLEKLIKYETVYIYGIGRESYFFLENFLFKSEIKNIILIDNNQYKINNLKINKYNIHASSYIDYNNKNSAIFVAAIAHREEIVDSLLRGGYKGEII